MAIGGLRVLSSVRRIRPPSIDRPGPENDRISKLRRHGQVTMQRARAPATAPAWNRDSDVDS